MKIFPKIKKPIFRILDNLKTEDEVKIDITYRRWASQSRATGKPVNAYTDHPLTALRLRHSDDTIKLVGSRAGDSPIQKGDIIYMIDHRDFPTDTSLKDVILLSDGSEERIKEITPVFEIIDMVTVESGGN